MPATLSAARAARCWASCTCSLLGYTWWPPDEAAADAATPRPVTRERARAATPTRCTGGSSWRVRVRGSGSTCPAEVPSSTAEHANAHPSQAEHLSQSSQKPPACPLDELHGCNFEPCLAADAAAGEGLTARPGARVEGDQRDGDPGDVVGDVVPAEVERCHNGDRGIGPEH